jgi:uncharacterized protein with GYD domain
MARYITLINFTEPGIKTIKPYGMTGTRTAGSA